METLGSCSSSMRNHERDMERLMEVFGSSLSLDAIASAYHQAGLNVEQAGIILYELQETTSEISEVVKDTRGEASMSWSELSSEVLPDISCAEEGNATDLPLKATASTISGRKNESLKLSAERGLRHELPKEFSSEIAKEDGMLADIEEFLMHMLGDGFQLDKKKINEVLGVCGYDLEKSMETLVGISASTLEKSDDVVSTSERELYQEIRPFWTYEKPQLADNPGPRLVKQNGKEPCKKSEETSQLQKEILGALFAAPVKVEEKPKKMMPRTRLSRSSAYGKPVSEPPKEPKIEQPFVTVIPLVESREVEDEEGENSFMVLRQAVREYWGTMKGYYKAAADAYAKGDKERAYKLMKEGQFFNKKAREADEKSAQLLLETRNDEILLDCSTFEPRETIKLLKLHLSNLAGISNICYLKVNVGSDDGQSKKGSRKQLVLKLLAKESIKWTESENGETIVIKLDEVNPKSLSFAKKQNPMPEKFTPPEL